MKKLDKILQWPLDFADTRTRTGALPAERRSGFGQVHCRGPLKNGAEPPDPHKCPHKVNTTETSPCRIYTTNTRFLFFVFFNDAGILMDASAASGGLSASQMWSAVTLKRRPPHPDLLGFLTFSASSCWRVPLIKRGPYQTGDGGHWTLELTH